MHDPRFRRLGSEMLERRTVLDGNVAAAVVAGDLVITGDAGQNLLNVWQDNATGDWMVGGAQAQGSPSTQTTVNGQVSPQAFSGVTGGLSVDMGDGGDVFVLSQAEVLGDAVFSGGEGFDYTYLSTGTIANNFSLELNGGTGLVLGPGLEFQGNLTINAGSGEDRAWIETPATIAGDFTYVGNGDLNQVQVVGAGLLTVGGNVSVDLGSGTTDLFGNVINNFAVSYQVGGNFVGTHTGAAGTTSTFRMFNMAAGDVTVTGAAGKTTVHLEDGSLGDVLLNLGDGADIVFAEDLAGDSFTMNMAGGDNRDSRLQTSSFAGAVEVNLGAGFDAYSIATVTASSIAVTSGSEADAIIAFNLNAVDVSFDTGDGSDVIGVYHVTATNLTVVTGEGAEGGGLAFGLVVGTCTVTGLLTVDSGAGLDNILLGSVTAPNVDLRSGDQSDGVIVLYSNLGAVSIDSGAATGDDGDVVGCHDSVFDDLDVLLGAGFDQLWLGNLTVNNTTELDGQADGGELYESGTNALGGLSSNLTPHL